MSVFIIRSECYSKIHLLKFNIFFNLSNVVSKRISISFPYTVSFSFSGKIKISNDVPLTSSSLRTKAPIPSELFVTQKYLIIFQAFVIVMSTNIELLSAVKLLLICLNLNTMHTEKINISLFLVTAVIAQ